MMIMKFHKLIQSRLVWIIFLGLVVISFGVMGALEYAGDSNVSRRLEEPVAHLDGTPITFLELDTTRRLLDLNFQGQIPRDRMDDFAFERIAMVRFARKLGLEVPRSAAEQEYARELIDDDGRIDPELRTLYRNFFARHRLTEDAQIEYIREQMLVQDLQRLLTTFSINTDFDVERWAAIETDHFETRRILLTPDLLPEPVEVSEDMLAAFFADYQEDFTIPQARKVHYVTLALEDFHQDTDTLSEAAAREIYDSNPDRFSRPVQVENEDGTTSWDFPTRPFEDVKAEIIDVHRNSRARERAKEDALGISVRLTPRRGRPAPTIQTVAEQEGLPLNTTDFFRRGDSIPGIANANRFIQAAFALDQSPIGRTSQPVDAQNHIHILQLAEIEPARVPELAEVEEEVRSAALEYYTQQALTAFAESLKADLRDLLDAGTEFSDAISQLGIEAEEVMPFQIQDMEAGSPVFPMDVAMKVTAHTTGDLFGPVEDSRFGLKSLIYVTARTPMPEARERWILEEADMRRNEIDMQGFHEYFIDQVLLKNLVHARPASDEITEN